MSLSKFGHSSAGPTTQNSSRFLSSYRISSYEYTQDGNIDAKHLKICNVEAPSLDHDAVNKKYTDNATTKIDNLRKQDKETLTIQLNKLNGSVNTSLTSFNQKIKELEVAISNTHNYITALDDVLANLKEKVRTIEISVNIVINDLKNDLITISNKIENNEK